jgi:site-specific DNA-methyltransferase (adenine-specific)
VTIAFQNENVTLWHGDCREVMRALPAESVDLLWTDPPYGHGNHVDDWNARLNDHRGIEQQPISNDSADEMRAAVDAMLTEAARVLKRDCCCCCCCCCGGGGPRPTFAWVAQRMDSHGLAFFHSVIWDKVNPGLGWRFRRQHEMVMVAHRDGGKLRWADDNRAVPNIWRGAKPKGGEHPNEKPLALVLHFMELHSLPGDTVLDPFCGSGTTLIAALETGRKAIGIEIDERWIDVARRRLERWHSQMLLPLPHTPPPPPPQPDLLSPSLPSP